MPENKDTGSAYAFATDFHGNLGSLQKFLNCAKEMGVNHIIIGGDISPGRHEATPDSIANKKRFVETALRDIKALKDKFGGSISVVLGNNDLGIEEYFDDADREGVLKNVTNRVVQLNSDVQILGYPYVPYLKQSDVGRWCNPDAEITKHLQALQKKLRRDVKYTLANIHASPSCSPLSRSRYPNLNNPFVDRGSKGVRKFFETIFSGSGYAVTGLTGHVHKAWQQNAEISDRIGQSLVINPGASKEITRIVVGDLREPEDFKLITL